MGATTHAPLRSRQPNATAKACGAAQAQHSRRTSGRPKIKNQNKNMSKNRSKKKKKGNKNQTKKHSKEQEHVPIKKTPESDACRLCAAP